MSPRNLNSTMSSALADGLISPAFLVQIACNSGTIYAWSGVGNLVYGGNTYLGVGSLGQISGIVEGSAVKADGCTVTLSGIWAGLLSGIPVLVPATAMPWATGGGQNASYLFGLDDGSPPVVVPLALAAGESVTVAATGLDSVSGGGSIFGGGTAGPAGDGTVTGANGGITGTYYPTKYMSGSTLGNGGLCGAFTDADGNVIQPLSIGAGGTFTVPTGAVQLQLGIDDDQFANNSGYFMASVTPPGAGVGSNSLLQEALTDIRLGAPAFIYFGLMSGGALISAPFLLFYGSVDKPTIRTGAGTITISLALENRLVNLQRASQRRYTAADQHLNYPDDIGFNWVEILNDIALFWG